MIEHGANLENVLGIPDLTTGCLFRLCCYVNDDAAIFTKFSLVFPCGNEKPQTNIYILKNNIISTYHELNLNRFWVIPHGENDNSKFAAKSDIWILKHWWFLKACRELKIRWNSPVSNLSPTLIPRIHCQIARACFLLRFSWAEFICLYSGHWFPPFYGYRRSFQFSWIF